jgi:uncharacterized membrane protein
MKRISSIDITRGIVMIIMALDHVRDLIHVNSITQSPTDLSTTTPALFFTRWITYLCAPIFVFLAGTSAYISFKNKGDIAQSRRFLLKRGLWLMLLEFTIVNFGLFFDIQFHIYIFEVIATIGFGFIMLSFLLKMPLKTISIIGFSILFLQGLFPLIPFAKASTLQAILSPLFLPGAIPVDTQTTFIMGYPPLPWLGIMLLGFAAGKLFELSDSKRRSLFIKIGVSALLFFIVFRFINIYSDPSPWSRQKDAAYTFLSFMNVTKYPPSLMFCSVTLGILFLILAWTEQLKSNITNIPSVYGKVPLFYFIIHFYLIHITMIVIMYLQGFHWQNLDFASGSFGRPKGVESGLSLGAVYLIWIAVVLLLYKPCRWYGRYKATHNQFWLRYI